MKKNILTALRVHKFYILDMLLFAVYLYIGLNLLPLHEPWSDEIQPWLMARDMSFSDLAKAMYHNYDRHPGLWYFIMHGISLLGFTIEGASYANFIFCATAIGLILFKAPFARPFKYAFMFSYYMLYEYPILARHYSLTLLLMVIIACLYASRFKRPVLFGAVIFLLFNSAYITLGFTFTLFAVYLWELSRQEKISSAQWLGIALMTAGFMLVFIQGGILPPNHVDYQNPRSAKYIQETWFLTRTLFPQPGQLSPAWDTFITLALTAVALLSLIRSPLCLMILCGGYAMLIYIFKFHHWGDLRHYGFFIHILLFTFWIKHNYQEIDWKFLKWVPCRICGKITLFTLGACFLAGTSFTQTIIKLEQKSLFSGGKFMASQITQMYDHFKLYDKDITIVAHPHTRAVAVINYLPRVKFWVPGSKEYATYFLNTKEMKDASEISQEEVLRELEANFTDLSKVFLLLAKPLEINETKIAKYVLLVDMTNMPVHGYVQEKFYLYKPIKK